MPPTSEVQRRLVHAIDKNPSLAKKTGMSAEVAHEFAAADKPGKLPERKATKPAKKR